MKPLLRDLSVFFAIPSSRSLVTMTALAMSCALTSCGNGNSPSSTQAEPPATPPAQLLQNDLQALRTISATGFQRYDTLSDGAFTAVFGGANASSLVTYLNERVHYYLTEESDASIYPANFDIDGWEKDGGNLGDEKPIQSGNLVSPLGDTGGVVVGAINIGTQLWLDGLVNNVPVTLRMGQDMIPVNSSRVGIIVLGEGYTDEIKDGDGNWMKLPAFVRQGILLHEARHSDCTGGIGEKDLEVARRATSAQEFARVTTMTSCGHLHSFCPKNLKPYGDLPACDSEPWGAYSVEATFLSAVAHGDLNPVDRNIALAETIDRESRVIGSGRDVIDRRRDAGAPDMSSSGLREDH